ncbi:MAG: pyridoxal phosphate-dependent aminotransferase [Anaerolineae bacterium]|nr:pyridoxal phosphate-dependent aminotransferase [Anaerolineae bacterium]
MKVAERVKRLPGEGAIEVLARALALEAEGADIIHLEVGEPDFKTPANILEAGIRALEAGDTRYSPAPGIPELREAIAQDLSVRLGIEVKPEEVVVTPGGKAIAFFAFLALLEPGDEVIYTNPGFPVYEAMTDFIGAKGVPLRLLEERGFRFEVDDFLSKVSPKTKLIVINSPHNPTGSVLTKSELEMVAEVAVERGLWVLSDEVYNRIIYEGEYLSIASLPGMQTRTIILNSFSKSYAMTGWRLGFGIMPPELASHITRLVINSNSCTPPFIQRAGIEALKGSQEAVTRMVAAFRERREVIVEGLNSIEGLRTVKPQGAFYVFPNIEGVGMGSREFAGYLLKEAGVALLPGTAFGDYGEGFIRISYANSLDNIRKALDRISKAVARL